MSGTFNEIDVPPTLVSFAVDVASDKTIITPELKKAGSKLVLLKVEKDEYDLPVYGQVMDQYGKFFEDVKAGKLSLLTLWTARELQQQSAKWHSEIRWVSRLNIM